MWIPFSKQIDATFKSDRRLPLKLLVGAVVGLFLGISLSLRLAANEDLNSSPLAVYAVLTGGCVVLSVALVIVLSLKDAVRHRIVSGRPVNRLLRLLLASGYVSLAAWLLLATAAAFAIASAWN